MNHNNEGNKCIECFSEDIYHDEDFGFYKCRACRLMWGFDKNDPDYEEALYVANLPSEDDEHIADLMRKQDEKEKEEFEEERYRQSDL